MRRAKVKATAEAEAEAEVVKGKGEDIDIDRVTTTISNALGNTTTSTVLKAIPYRILKILVFIDG